MEKEGESRERSGHGTTGGRHRRPSVRRAELEPVPPTASLLTKEDLSQFLSIKPYLSSKAQAIVDLLDEIGKSGGRLEPANLTRLLGLVAGDGANLGALASLAGMVGGGGGKLDPTTLVSLLGAFNRTTPSQEK